MNDLLSRLQEELPADWLQIHRVEYMTLVEKIIYTVIKVEAGQQQWGKQIVSREDYQEFFESEAVRHQKKPEEIRGFFYQMAQFKAKEQIFEDNYADLVPRDENKNSLIPRKDLERFVHSAKA